MALRINNQQLNAILLAGQKMSNLCFNLSQRTAELTERHRQAMKECQQEWDAVYPKKSYMKPKKSEVGGQ